MNGALMLITMPQLLAAQHAPEARIATITAMALAPGWISFVLAPLLDWRFSRRTWAVVFTLVTAAGSAAAFLFVRRLDVLPAFFFVSNLGAYLVAAACGGWFGELVARERQGTLGAWFAAVNIASGGLAAAIAIPVFRGLPEPAGALVLGGCNLLALPICSPRLARPPTPAGPRGRHRLCQGRQPRGPTADRAVDPAAVRLSGDGLRPDQLVVGLRGRLSYRRGAGRADRRRWRLRGRPWSAACSRRTWAPDFVPGCSTWSSAWLARASAFC
ncbi:MAG: hypothetical protein WDM85_05325 [Caulobacteraceae bacterium]